MSFSSVFEGLRVEDYRLAHELAKKNRYLICRNVAHDNGEWTWSQTLCWRARPRTGRTRKGQGSQDALTSCFTRPIITLPTDSINDFFAVPVVSHRMSTRAKPPDCMAFCPDLAEEWRLFLYQKVENKSNLDPVAFKSKPTWMRGTFVLS